MSEPTSNVNRGRWQAAAVFLGCLFSASTIFAFPVDVAEAPRNDLYLTLRTIQSAQKTILLNVYEMKSADVADAVIERLQAGVRVEILEEGQPVGGVSEDSIETRNRIATAMRKARGNSHLYVMEGGRHRFRRYRFDHAKYIIVDDKDLLVGSENYSGRLNAPDRKPGNRGWVALLHRPELAAEYKAMFAKDSDPKHGDLHDLVNDGRRVPFESAFAPFDLGALESRPRTKHTQIPGDAIAQFEAQGVQSVVSPDSSLKGLTGLLDQAKQSVKLELMSFSAKWGSTSHSPLYTAVLAAARRGVKVQVLLNDERAFLQHHEIDYAPNSSSSKFKNPILAKLFNDAAEEEGLELEAKIADLNAMNVSYIHNKGMLVDGSRVLISLINWNQNSVENNRETAVVLDGAEINHFYDQRFDADWAH